MSDRSFTSSVSLSIDILAAAVLFSAVADFGSKLRDVCSISYSILYQVFYAVML